MDDYTIQRNNLHQKQKDLVEKLQMLTWSLQENLVDTYVNFTLTKSLEQINYKHRKKNLLTEYNTLEDSAKKLKEKFGKIDEELQSTLKKLENSIDLLNNYSVSVEAKRVLETADRDFRKFNYMEAMLSIEKLLNSLKKIKFDGKPGKAIANIISQAESQHSLYAANISIEWEDIFSWSETKGVNFLTYSLIVQQSDPILIQNVLKTLFVTKRMNSELGLFSHFFIDKILHNVIRHNCEILTEEIIPPNHTIVLHINIDLKDTSVPNYLVIFTNLMAIFDFVQLTLGSRFDENKTFIGVFADNIKGKFFDKIIEDCIRNNLPSCDSSYENYKNLVLELDTFNKFLIDLKFVDADESPLNEFIKDTECVLYNKKCDKLLFDIREMLNEPITYGTLIVGIPSHSLNGSLIDVTDKVTIWDINKPLFLPKCVISQNVKQIMTAIVEHLEEAAKLPQRYSEQLISYIKSIAVMYQCLVPKKFKVNLDNCPMDIALFFNNCFYMAHGLIGPPWKSILPAPLAEKLTTVLFECIQDLRVLGLEKISLYLQTQNNIITKNILLEEPQPWTHESFYQFDCAINEALTFMKDLKQNWHNILPTKMYELALCMVIEVLCQVVMQRILSDCRPLDEELVYMIAVRVEEIRKDILALFEEPINLDKKMAIWRKLTSCPRLLKAQLLEISKIWSERQLDTYSCEEVRQIVKMRFPDDKYRLKILMEIQ